jgi:hypothetical protein
MGRENRVLRKGIVRKKIREGYVVGPVQ